MPGPPPPPPPQYTQEPDKPPADWVPPPDLVEEVSNDPDISPLVKGSIQQRASEHENEHDNEYENEDGNGDNGPSGPPPVVMGNGYHEEEYDQDNKDYNGTEENGDAPVGYDYGAAMNDDAQYSGPAVLSTGNLLEDLDNMLRIYRMTIDDVERSKLYVEFWKKFNELKNDQPKELLKIPTKIRGFLYILEHIPPYQADNIMKDLLSQGGLLAEPEFIERRYILKLFLIYEFGNIFSWIGSNIKTLKAWMFIFSLTLSVAIFTHIFVDFWAGNVWRAILMEFLFPVSLISTAQFVDTPFFACVIRVIIEDNCSALATIPGRIFFNILIVFFCVSSWEYQDVAILFAALIAGIWTFIIFITYSRLMSSSAHVRILTGSSSKLEQKFLQYDQDRDGVLNMQELKLFFENGFRQTMSNWQLEMMIMQYDIQRDNGLRFEAMDIWFRKQPINADTRSQALSAKPREFYGITDNGNSNGNQMAFSQQELEWQQLGLAGMQRNSQAHNLALSAMGV